MAKQDIVMIPKGGSGNYRVARKIQYVGRDHRFDLSVLTALQALEF